MENIEKFDTYVAIILERLYNEFPLKTSFSAKDIIINENDEFFIAEVFDFLREYEFLVFEPLMGGVYEEVRLTMKGLAILKAIPQSLDGNKESNGERLKRQVKEALQKGGYKVLSQISNAIIGTSINKMFF